MRLWQTATRRLIDVMLGLAALMPLLPVMALVRVAVALDSSGGPYAALAVGVVVPLA